MSSRPLFYLLDGHSLAYRHHFALTANMSSPMTTSSGEPTSAVFGFAKQLMDILEKDKPRYLAVTFDDGLSGRDTLYTDYKGTRDKMPDDLSTQMQRIFQLVAAFNIPILMVSGYEADDVIGTVATQAVPHGVDVRIVSGDGDILQLLSPHIGVQLRVRRKDEKGKFVVRDIVYDEEIFRAEYGFEPRQLIDYKALKGDTSDNIPGVAGIGDKTATTLINEYGSIEGIYENIQLIKGANQKKLLEGRDSAFLSKNLATIRCDVPVQFDLEKCVAHDFDYRQVDALYAELEFNSHRKQLARFSAPAAGAQMSLFDAPGGETIETPESLNPPNVDTVIVQDTAALDELVAALNSAHMISFDTETTGINPVAAELVGISLSADGVRGYYIPVGHRSGQQLPLEQVIEALRPPLTNPNIGKIAHNASYDLLVLQRYGIDVHPITFDTMIAEWVRDPGSNTLGLKALVKERLKENMTEIEALIGKGKTQITMDQVEIERAAPYAVADAVFTHQLVEQLRADLEKDNLLRLFNEIEMPLIPVIVAMERAGVLLDVDYLQVMSEKLTQRMGEIEAEIHALSGMGAFNINSPKQLNEVLFEKLGLKADGVRKTSHGYSTAADVLDNMRGEHPIIDKILEYRELSKLKSTYVDALPSMINPRTGRVHTSFNQAGSITGRLSSNSPNLQNIPIRSELGREVRRAFITPPGFALLAVDYSQIELRIMAHHTQDPMLVEAFRSGQDIHAATAAAVNRVPIEEVTFEQRVLAKRVNFGILYGMGARRLARESALTYAEADKFIKTYFERLPGVNQYIQQTNEFVRKHGYVESLIYHRRRHFPVFEEAMKRYNYAKEQARTVGEAEQVSLDKVVGRSNDVQRAEREAINMPIQGTAAEIIKKAMIEIHRELRQRGLGARLLLQVHDELVLEVPERELEQTQKLVVEIMENTVELRVPLRANAEVGQNWCDMEATSV